MSNRIPLVTSGALKAVHTENWQLLYDNNEGTLVFVHFTYGPDGNILSSEGFNLDGTPYVGVVANLWWPGHVTGAVIIQGDGNGFDTLNMVAGESVNIVPVGGAVNNFSRVAVQLEGIWTGSVTLTAKAGGSGSQTAVLVQNATTGVAAAAMTANGLYYATVIGSAGTLLTGAAGGTGTANIRWGWSAF